jgi:beta-lactamase regulating signal transducer with metallopeptidase domain
MTLIVSWLWQGLAIAWVIAAAVRAMPRLNAATRHAIWWLALAAVLAIPLAQWLAAIGPDTPPAPDLMGSLDAAGAFVLPPFPDGVVAGAAALWAITATVGVLRIVRSCRTLGRLKRASMPFDRSREACLPLWAAAHDGGHRSAELRSSDCVTGACALGLRRPVIIVSRSVAEALNDESLDEIVMHEQAHLDRFDDWSQLLQALVCSLAGLHPAVRFLARRLDVDREAACDDRVVSRTGARRRYADSLLTVAAASNPEAGGIAFAAGAPTATTTASALRVRVVRLLDPRRDHDARLARATSLVSVTALALTVVMSTQVAPVVVFLEAAIINGPASPSAPAIEVRRAPEPAPRANMNVAAGTLERPPHRTFRRLKRTTLSDPPEAPAPQAVGAPPDAPPTAPLDSRIIAVNGTASVSAVSLPSLQRAGIAPEATPASAPWDAVTISTTSAADGVARAAVATGARARSAGVSIGRFFGRASKAGANIF